MNIFLRFKRKIRTQIILIFSIAFFLIMNGLHAEVILLEAEDAVLTGVYKITASSGNSGSGYVSGFDNAGDQVTFIFSATAELYSVIIGFRTPHGSKGFELTVNGNISSGMFPATGTFSEYDAGKYQLLQGQNTIAIGGGWNWYEIDYIKVSSGATVERPLKPPAVLADKNASASAKSLFSFLIDQYGVNVLAGQQDLVEINYIESVTGKLPAVGAFDLMDYSPSRIEHGTNPAGIWSCEAWIDWADRNNGIVSLTWHWNAPADLIDTPGHEWWSGFYTHATTFDFKAALDDENSENYQLILRDIDAIAVQLKKFQDADIPVLWRPLHEASGGWFWWGARGAEAYQQLWRLLFERLTQYHEIHNLIWVATTDYSWLAGDDYVDIVGLDIYTDPSSSMSGEWENIQEQMNGRKLVALSESGTLPDPDKIRTFATWWSWFSIWSGDFIRNIDEDILKSVYDDENIITLDELPDWRNYTSIEEIHSPVLQKMNIHIYPNPFNPSTTIEYNLCESKDIEIDVFNLSGQTVLSKKCGNKPAGTHTQSFNGTHLQSGSYIVQIKANDLILNKKMIILK